MRDFQSQNQRYEQQPGAWGSFGMETAARASVSERMGFVRKVYALFFAATLFAIGGVWLGLSFEPLLQFAYGHPWVMLFVMLGGVMGAQAVRHVPGVNLAALFGFTTLTGVVISPLISVILRINPGSILAAC
jgi:modulator of FtsH protease